MATITEDYCSYEVAKLLNEKGFRVNTDKDYWKIGEDGTMYFMCSIGVYTSDPNNKNAFYRPASSYPCPTQSMAMKWLREVHNLCIEPYRTASGYLYTISKIWTGSEIYSDEFNGDDEDSGQWTTYEESCEAAIKYCLENLI